MRKLVITSVIIIAFIASCQAKKETFLDGIQLNSLSGEIVSNEQYQDKIVILNLWATWCNPCIKEMPDLVKMQSELPKGFVLLTASDEDLEKIQTFSERRSFDLTFLQIQNSMESLGVYSLPTTFIIGKDGQLIEAIVGFRKWSSQEQIERLKTYLK
jgi:thiol-disulfide isomerase/thioredoxin